MKIKIFLITNNESLYEISWNITIISLVHEIYIAQYSIRDTDNTAILIIIYLLHIGSTMYILFIEFVK